MSTPPLIDRAILDDLFESIGVEGTCSVLELFIGESRTYLATIAEAVARPLDPACRERARRAAHSLKSGAGQIGAAAMAIAAAAVEEASTDEAPDLTVVAAALGRCAEDTVRALAVLLQQVSR
jgi:HPt (histidine-containing phosphotransfer) domain-containing protein